MIPRRSQCPASARADGGWKGNPKLQLYGGLSESVHRAIPRQKPTTYDAKHLLVGPRRQGPESQHDKFPGNRESESGFRRDAAHHAACDSFPLVTIVTTNETKRIIRQTEGAERSPRLFVQLEFGGSSYA